MEYNCPLSAKQKLLLYFSAESNIMKSTEDNRTKRGTVLLTDRDALYIYFDETLYLPWTELCMEVGSNV